MYTFLIRSETHKDIYYYLMSEVLPGDLNAAWSRFLQQVSGLLLDSQACESFFVFVFLTIFLFLFL